MIPALTSSALLIFILSITQHDEDDDDEPMTPFVFSKPRQARSGILADTCSQTVSLISHDDRSLSR